MQTTAVTLAALLFLGSLAEAAEPVRLADGSSIDLIALREIVLPDGVRGVEVYYRTDLELGDDAILRQFGAVWSAFLPELRRRGKPHGVLHATRRTAGEGGATVPSLMQRACLTPTGDTLWLHLDGSRSRDDERAGRRCANGAVGR
jgi:hypothetical protein